MLTLLLCHVHIFCSVYTFDKNVFEIKIITSSRGFFHYSLTALKRHLSFFSYGFGYAEARYFLLRTDHNVII
jgi:hypothetical protein